MKNDIILHWKNLSALLRRITSKHVGDFYCLNCPHSFRTKNKLESPKKVCENKDFRTVLMYSKDSKILEFNQYRKSDKTPSIISADVESLIKRIDVCKNNFEKSSTTKVGEHIPCGYSMSTIWKFDGIENKHDVYSGEDCMKKFCESLWEHTMKIINFEKKKNDTINKHTAGIVWKTKIYYICKKSSNKSTLMIKTIANLGPLPLYW